MDNLLESDPSEIKISVIPSSADFSIEPNPLILENGNQVQFTDFSFAPSDWHWFINEQLVEVAQHPLLSFDSTGSYQIKLQVSSEEGCTFEKTRTLEVRAVMGIAEDFIKQAILYPNPVGEILTIDLQQSPNERYTIEIFDLSGRKLLQHRLDNQLTSINITGFSPGIYSLILKSKNRIQNHRIIVQ